MLKTLLSAAAAFLLLVSVSYLLLDYAKLYINISASIPRGLYQTKAPDIINKGDLLLSCLKPDQAKSALRRGYIVSGTCPAHSAPIGKYAAARAGDLVVIDKKGIQVNGKLLEQSQPLTQDQQRRRLQQIKVHKQLESGELILFAPGNNSFDSRYLGIVHISQIHPSLSIKSI